MCIVLRSLTRVSKKSLECIDVDGLVRLVDYLALGIWSWLLDPETSCVPWG